MHLLVAIRVIMAGNGAEALKVTKQFSVDAILMDCQMPVMDGLTATRRIRELERQQRAERVPIIALTANVVAKIGLVARQPGWTRTWQSP